MSTFHQNSGEYLKCQDWLSSSHGALRRQAALMAMLGMEAPFDVLPVSKTKKLLMVIAFLWGSKGPHLVPMENASIRVSILIPDTIVVF